MEIKVPSIVRIKPDALNKIGKYLRMQGFTDIALFFGKGIEALFGDTIHISLESSEIHVASCETIDTNLAEDVYAKISSIGPEVKALVAVGGGKVIDFVKYLGHITHLPVMSVPTIISNDGFCSPLSAMVMEGRRRTVLSAIPHGVIIDTEILKNSPRQYLYSGMGDLFCKLTAIYDWKLAYNRTGEYVNDFAAIIAQNAVDLFLNYDHRDVDNLDYIGIIASSLLMSGLSMAVAGSSRPASGSEHLISHAFDKFAGNGTSLHGLQVGVASYAVSFLQKDTHPAIKKAIKDCGFLEFIEENPLDRTSFIEAVKFAPDIKPGYYTILSEKGAIERLIEFASTDKYMNRMLA